jgi:hypothetical protein
MPSAGQCTRTDRLRIRNILQFGRRDRPGGRGSVNAVLNLHNKDPYHKPG